MAGVSAGNDGSRLTTSKRIATFPIGRPGAGSGVGDADELRLRFAQIHRRAGRKLREVDDDVVARRDRDVQRSGC